MCFFARMTSSENSCMSRTDHDADVHTVSVNPAHAHDHLSECHESHGGKSTSMTHSVQVNICRFTHLTSNAISFNDKIN